MSNQKFRRYILRELLQIKNGKDHKDLANGTIPVYGSGGIMRYADKYIYNDESILLPRKGTLSNIQYVAKPFWTVDTIYYTIVNRKLADVYYLFSYLSILDLSRLNSGTGVPSMTFDAYYDLEVFLPDLLTQQKITSVLSSLDAKIELNNRINAELEAMAKTLYDYWFVQFDFPDANGKPYKTSGGKMVWNEELKKDVPEGWEVMPLSKLCFKIGDGIHSTPNYVNESDFYFINGNNLKNGFININENTKQVDAVEYYKYYIDLNKDSLLMSINGTIGNVAMFDNEKVMLGKSAAYLNCKATNKFFVYHYLQLDAVQKKLWNIATGSTIKNLSLDSLNNLRIATPGVALSDKFNDICNSIHIKRQQIFRENQKLAELRDWLLPMLMNGQIRVGGYATAEEEEQSYMMAAEPEVEYGRGKK